MKKKMEDEDEEVELEDIYINLPESIRKRYNITEDDGGGKYHCFIDDEGTIYQRLEEDEVGEILGEWKEGNFFEC